MIYYFCAEFLLFQLMLFYNITLITLQSMKILYLSCILYWKHCMGLVTAEKESHKINLIFVVLKRKGNFPSFKNIVDKFWIFEILITFNAVFTKMFYTSILQEKALDEKSRLILYKMLNNGTLDTISGIVSTGKEAVVIHAKGGEYAIFVFCFFFVKKYIYRNQL